MIPVSIGFKGLVYISHSINYTSILP
ncbi:hypothetical protein Pint_25811 [Pistacia integerrima]|uniref:Uncharacterized protein n=1 Tax=Pistacia integerrima TaxID=434235 RepID=A0ACC0YHM4_9ROSI|nr:hypothetical protein Pint_25811 [Pistacia integerrima]